MNYLNTFNLLSSQQYGFRPGYSTEVALINFVDNLKEAIHDGSIVGALFIYLTKAFDTINHSILIHKIESFGITGPPLDFIRSDLSNRSQLVLVNNTFSNTQAVYTGVP